MFVALQQLVEKLTFQLVRRRGAGLMGDQKHGKSREVGVLTRIPSAVGWVGVNGYFLQSHIFFSRVMMMMMKTL